MTSDYSTKFDPDALRRFISQGVTAKEIVKKFGISFYTLKEHLELLNRKDRKQYEIKGLKEAEDEARRVVRKRKGYVCALDSDCMPGFRFADSFEMFESGGRVFLKKIK